MLQPGGVFNAMVVRGLREIMSQPVMFWFGTMLQNQPRGEAILWRDNLGMFMEFQHAVEALFVAQVHGDTDRKAIFLVGSQHVRELLAYRTGRRWERRSHPNVGHNQ